MDNRGSNLHYRSYYPKDLVEGPVDLEFECPPNIDKDVHDGNIQTVTRALPIVLYSMILEEKETVAVEKVTKKKMFLVRTCFIVTFTYSPHCNIPFGLERFRLEVVLQL